MGEPDAYRFTDAEGILWKSKFFGKEILFNKAKAVNPAWTEQAFDLVDEDTIDGVMEGSIGPETIRPPEPDFKAPEKDLQAEVSKDRPPPPGGHTPLATKSKSEATAASPAAPEALAEPLPALPEMPTPEAAPAVPVAPAAPALPVAPNMEPQADYKKLLSIIEAAAQLADSSAETAKGLLDSHGLEEPFCRLHPEKVEALYGDEKASEPIAGVGSVILALEVFQNCLHIITTDGVITFSGTNIRGTRDDDT